MKLYQASYTVVRFIPDLTKNEPINIGLILHSSEDGYIRTEFSSEKARIIGHYNKDIDPNVINYIIDDVTENYDNEKLLFRNDKMGNFKDDKLLNKLFAAHSNQLQFTRPKGIISNDLDEEFKRLFEEIVYKEIVIKRYRSIAERTMRSDIRRKFDKFDLIKNKIIKENYVEKDSFGAKIRLDFKYNNGKPNLIKNLSLDVKSIDPMEYSKAWLTNYRELKKSASKDGFDRDVHLIYCLPTEEKHNVNSSVLACLTEASDKLIDYRDTEKVDYFIKQVAEVANN